MAQSNPTVYLGYDDEYITENHKGIVNFTTNKVGGKPDWPSNVKIENPQCPLCQLPRPLILQIYAPIENSTYHRTLYIFACINPNCWNHNESWTCLRTQTLEQAIQSTVKDPSATSKSITGVTKWCQDADDWEDENNTNMNEENGNLINNAEKYSDEDDESYSFDDSIRAGLGNLSVDDCNANTGVSPEAQGGAVGRLHSPAATAEIEGDEGEVISIDTPTIPQHDIIALLQEVTPLPQDLCQMAKFDLQRSSVLQFISYFVSVGEEMKTSTNISDRHVRELLQEYQQSSEEITNFTNSGIDLSDGGAVADDGVSEKYEKGIPVHGDKMFHYYLSKIQMNPGQILRYCRESSCPLLLYPLQEIKRKCSHCQGELVFELQILPTLIPKLQLMSDLKTITRIEFGNVLVFTCKRSCWFTDTNCQHEVVVVQTEIY